jgi:hypothetical protein
MNYLKVLATVIVTGVSVSACTTECYECTASDPNGQGATVSDEVCKQNLNDSDRDEFEASFSAIHNPALYNITCNDK